MAQAQVNEEAILAPSKSEIVTCGTKELGNLVSSAEKLLANLKEHLSQDVVVKPGGDDDDEEEGSSGAASPASDQTDRLGLMSVNLISKLGSSKPSAQFEADYEAFAVAYAKLAALLKAAQAYLPQENGSCEAKEGAFVEKKKRLETLRAQVKEKNKAVVYLIERVAQLRQQLLLMD